MSLYAFYILYLFYFLFFFQVSRIFFSMVLYEELKKDKYRILYSLCLLDNNIDDKDYEMYFITNRFTS